MILFCLFLLVEINMLQPYNKNVIFALKYEGCG